jgi:hypothetical protein
VNNSVHAPAAACPRECRSGLCRGAAGWWWWRRRARRGVRHSSSVLQQRGESEATAQCPDQRPHEAHCTFSSGQRALCMPVRHSQSQAGGRRDAAGGGALPLACPASSCAAHTGPSNACRRHNGRRWRRSRALKGALWQTKCRQDPRTRAAALQAGLAQQEVTLREVLVSHVKSP